MPDIITATDFSDAATNAVHYACKLAVATSSSVTVLHSFILPIAFNDIPMPVVPLDEGKEAAEDNMKELCDDLRKQYPSLDIRYKVTYGDITDSLQEYVEENRPWIIVLGNSSNEDTSFWLGSNLLNAMRELESIVLAIPAGAVYNGIKNICYACDLKHVLDKLPSNQLMDLVAKTGAQLHILNINHDSHSDLAAPSEASALQDALQKVSPQFHFADNSDIDKGIHDFMESNRMDWLVVVPHNHGFFEGLFHKSHTAALVRTSHIPLVALHEKG